MLEGEAKNIHEQICQIVIPEGADTTERHHSRPPEFAESGKQVIEAITAGYKSSTAETYCREVAKLVSTLGGELLDWNSDDILDILNGHKSNGNRTKALAVARLVDRTLSELYPDRCPWNLATTHYIKKNTRPLDPLTREQLDGLFGAADAAVKDQGTLAAVRNRALVMAGYQTGLPVTKIVGLNWGAVSVAGKKDITLTYPSGYKHQFPSRASEAITTLYDLLGINSNSGEMPLFLNPRGERLHRQSMNNILTELEKPLEGSSLYKEEISPQTLRDTHVELTSPSVAQLMTRWGIRESAAREWISRRSLYRRSQNGTR